MWAGLFLAMMTGAMVVGSFAYRPAPDALAVGADKLRAVDVRVDPTDARARGQAANFAFYHTACIRQGIDNKAKIDAWFTANAGQNELAIGTADSDATYGKGLSTYLPPGYKQLGGTQASGSLFNYTCYAWNSPREMRTYVSILRSLNTGQSGGDRSEQELLRMESYLGAMLDKADRATGTGQTSAYTRVAAGAEKNTSTARIGLVARTARN